MALLQAVNERAYDLMAPETVAHQPPATSRRPSRQAARRKSRHHETHSFQPSRRVSDASLVRKDSHAKLAELANANNAKQECVIIVM